MKLESEENKKIDVLRAINSRDVELHINGWMNSIIFMPNTLLNQINNQLIIISDILNFNINMDIIEDVKKIGADYKIILKNGLEYMFFIV